MNLIARLYFCLSALLFPLNNLGDTVIRRTGSDSSLVIVNFEKTAQDQNGSIIGNLSIENISQTWVFVEQQFDESGLTEPLPHTAYIMGPGLVRRFPYRFSIGSYLKLKATSPLGVDFTRTDVALTVFGAFSVDLSTRALFSYEMPSDAFNEGALNLELAVVLQKLSEDLASKSAVHELVNAVKNGSTREVLSALVDILADDDFRSALKDVLKDRFKDEEVASAFERALDLLEILNLKSKIEAVVPLVYGTRITPSAWVNLRAEVRSTISPPPNSPSSLFASAVTPDQINLQWSYISDDEEGFIVERSSLASDWLGIARLPKNTLRFSDRGLMPSEDYNYRIRAFNSAGQSPAGNVASAMTPGISTVAATLSIDSLPATSVPVASFIGTAGYVSAKTPTNRSFTSGTIVNVTCAVVSPSGQPFQKWQLDGVDYAYSFTATIPMIASHTLTAIYGDAPPTRAVSRISIDGPAIMDEGISESYRLRAIYSDGTSAFVSSGVVWGIGAGATEAIISRAGVVDSGAVTEDREVEIRASLTVGNGSLLATKLVTIRNVAQKTVRTLTVNKPSGGDIGYAPKALRYADGTVVSLHANPDDGYVFSRWTGDVASTDTDDDIVIHMDRDRSIGAVFTVDTKVGNLRVDISPSRAVAEGAQWRQNELLAWKDSGSVLDGVTAGTKYQIGFKHVPGWITPASLKTSIRGGQTITLTGTYREILGSVTVSIDPAEAGVAGARWRLDGGGWLEGGVTLQEIAPGNHKIEYMGAGGWSAPSSRSVNVQRGVPSIINAQFSPPPGVPVITAVTPPFGGLDGGYLVAVDGVNFGSATTVSFDGVPATAVNLVSATRLTVTVPRGNRYGSVAVAVTSNGQAATKANGFTYSTSLARNMTLVSQIGGTVGAVAASGNTVFFGEGSGLVAADYSNPSQPVLRGRIALPGLVRDIKIAGNYALVANQDYGLQVVDVSNPASLRLVGFYDTPGRSHRLAITGSTAFLADEYGGLQAIDFSSPENPRRVGTFSLGIARDVAVTKIGSKVIVCAASQKSPTAVVVLDATDPSNIRQLSELPGGDITLAVDGSTLVCVQSSFGRIFDLSDPTAPKQTHQGSFFQSQDIGLVKAGFLYSGLREVVIWNLSQAPIPTRLSHTGLPGSTEGMALSGSLLFVARGVGGLVALDVNSPASPITRSTLNTGFVPTDIALDAGKVYAGLDEGIAIIDAAVPSQPTRMGSVNSSSGGKITVRDKVVYATRSTKLTSFSVLDPAAPAQSSAVDGKGSRYAIGFINGQVIVGSQDSSTDRALLSVYSPEGFRTGTAATILELTTVWGLPSAIAVSGNRAFVLGSGVGLQIIDFSAPQSPTIVGRLPLTGIPQDAAASSDGKYLYVAMVDQGMQVFNCSNPSQPVALTSYVRSGQTQGQAVAVAGNSVLYADFNGLNVLDGTDPVNPKLVGWYDTPGLPIAVKADAKNVYVADGEGGLLIIQLADLSRPLVEITSPTQNATFEANAGAIALSGTASDSGGIVRVTWRSSRGPAGEATGTATWSIGKIPLSSGPNVVNVTAEDSTGNLVEDSITIIATLPDANAPVLMITGPTPESEFSTSEDRVTLKGSVVDDRAVSKVTWRNVSGGSGTASLSSQSWIIENIELIPGPNAIDVTATDSSKNVATSRVVIFFSQHDVSPPTITIDFPTLQTVFATDASRVNLSGWATDDTGVVQVQWINQRGGSGLASGASPWSVNDIPLKSGLNIIEVGAYDAAGNFSSDSLAVTLTQPLPMAKFVSADASRKGDWLGRYGRDGFVVMGDVTQYPSYVTLTRSGKSDFNWNLTSTDPRSLQRSGGAGRAAACWYSGTEFQLGIDFKDASQHRVAFYMVDFDGRGSRAQTVEVWDLAGQNLLDSRTVAGFTEGQYLIWDFAESVQVRFKNLGGPSANAVLSGIFFDPPSALANFVAEHEATSGNWPGAFGSRGYKLGALPSPIQSGLAGEILKGQAYIWAYSSSEGRALLKPDTAARFAGCWYSGDEIVVRLDAGTEEAQRVALYFLDWDSEIRSQTVEVSDSAGRLLDRRSVEKFHDGRYLVWDAWGSITFRIHNENPRANAVLSGIFLDPVPSATFRGEDAQTQGNWSGNYGADGFNIAGITESLPGYVRASLRPNLPYVWQGISDQPRALQRPNNGRSVASCWYDPSQIEIRSRVLDDEQHRVSLYLLDWDGTGRSQRLEARDWLSRRILDRRYESSFTGGRYVSWDVGGTVDIVGDRVGGANVVISGIFFDPPQGAVTAATIRSEPFALTRQSGSETPELHISGRDGLHLLLTGRANAAVVLELSHNLLDWNPIETNSISEYGTLDLAVDPGSGEMPQFFRTRVEGDE